MFTDMVSADKIPVLLVEDSRNEAHVTERQLHAIDDEFTIHRVSRLGEALDYLATRKSSAVILDLGLPDSYGPDSVRALHDRFPEMPIVVLSGLQDPGTISRSFQYGAQEFLIKNECTGRSIRQAVLGAIIRKSLKK